MTFYVASRFGNKEFVRKIYEILQSKGHSITADWTQHKSIKPYDQNASMCGNYAIEDIGGVKDCDVFILVSGEGGTGMHTELGVAILSHILFGKPKIYVAGEHNKNSMFYYHPSVKRMEKIEYVFEDLGI